MICFLGIWKIQKNWLSKTTKIPRQSKLVRTCRRFFVVLHYFWFSRIYCYFKSFLWFSDLQDLSRFHHWQNLWKRSEKPIVLDPPDFENKIKNQFHILMSGSVTNIGNFGSFLWLVNMFVLFMNDIFWWLIAFSVISYIN